MLLALIAFGVGLASLAYWASQSLRDEDVFSIGLYSGPSPLDLRPHPSIPKQPVLTSLDVTDVRADFIADPFLLREDGRWFMFFEVLNQSRQKGEIALASSSDGLTWTYDRVVLREPFHLSYPYVFRWQDRIYMIPETGDAQAVRLYEARAFPHDWSCVATLLSGPYRDASLVLHEERWWLFALRDLRELSLHVSASLLGPWNEHPASPIKVPDAGAIRPGGRPTPYNGTLIRYAQDGRVSYGRELRAFQIDELTATMYREHEAAESPVLGPALARTWNADGMHHTDPMQLEDGTWIAVVDGKKVVRRVRWRFGARRIIDKLKPSYRTIP